MTQEETKRCLAPFLVDCHCHLSFLEENKVDQLVNQNLNNVWVMGGYQPSEWESQVQLQKKYPKKILTAYGLHPWYVRSEEFDLARDLEALKIWTDQSDLIGEVGLDFFGNETLLKKELQINVFEKQLELSSKRPFVFHIVQAHGKALEILNNYSVKGFVHSFSGSIEIAEKYLNDGILLSFGPNILNESFKKARETLKELPLESILLESDSPSHPLDDNDPIESLHSVYEYVCEIKKVGLESLRGQISANFQSLFKL